MTKTTSLRNLIQIQTELENRGVSSVRDSNFKWSYKKNNENIIIISVVDLCAQGNIEIDIDEESCSGFIEIPLLQNYGPYNLNQTIGDYINNKMVEMFFRVVNNIKCQLRSIGKGYLLMIGNIKGDSNFMDVRAIEILNKHI